MISLVGLYSQKALEAEEKEQLCGELLQRMWYDSFPCVVLESESLGRGLTKAGGLWHPPLPSCIPSRMWSLSLSTVLLSRLQI